jgi:hypothetical protein
MNQQPEPQQSHEIDLIELLSKIGQGIRNFFMALLKFISFIIIFGLRKIHFLLIFAVAGGAIGFILFKSTQRYYSSSMLAQPNGITCSDMINYINDLHDLCLKNNTNALSYDLQMSDTMAKKIKDIQAFFIIDINKDNVGDYVDFKNSFNLKDTTQKRIEDRLNVTVEVYDNKAFKNVRKGLFNYISTNPYLIKLNEIRKLELEQLISQTDIEIQKLDSLQNSDYFKKNIDLPVKETQMLFLSEKERRLYHGDKLNLLRNRQIYQKELELATDAFTVIKDFTSLAAAENPKSKYILQYMFIMVGLGYIITFVFHFRKSIFNYIKKI